ncbi:MAG: hypothetical protein ACRDYU_03710 [Actinomycetes bacterium]
MACIWHAAADGDRRATLEALRDKLAARMDRNGEGEIDDRALAPVARQLSEVMREIESLAPPEESTLDELAKQRAARQGRARGAKAAPPKRAAKKGVGGARGGTARGKRGSAP